MGLVTEHLIKMIQDQVDRHGVVVWFDPEDHYSHIAKDLTIPETRVFRYDQKQGFLSLRRILEPLWGDETPPKLVIYLPMARDETHHALIEYEVAGAVMRPGQQPPDRNTRLPVVARRALEGICPPVVLNQYIADAEAGKLNLFELDELAESCADGQIGTLSLIFETGNPDEIALVFLAESKFDQAVLEKNASADLAGLFKITFGVDFESHQNDLPALRAQLNRFILVNELRETLLGDLPEKLRGLPKPKNKPGKESALRVVQLWRQRSDLVDRYIQVTGKVEAEFGLGSIAWTVESIQDSFTFARLETQLQSLVEERLIETPNKTTIELAKKRLDGFWATQKPEIKLRWEIIARAGDVLVYAQYLESMLKSNKSPAIKLIEHYTSGEEPWCKLDTNFRHLDRDFHYFDFDERIHDNLIRLVASARQSYINVIDQLTKKFIHAYKNAGFESPGILHQVEIFHDFVEPAIPEEQIAYFLVDALRFEMAQELLEQLNEVWDTTISLGIGTPPTITEIGMAALMPGAEKGLTIVSPGANKLAALISNETLKDRSDRVNFLQSLENTSVEVIRLDQIAPLKDKKLRKSLTDANLIVVTAADEIDGFWETNPNMARRMQDDVFSQLQRGIRALFGIGVKRAIITADHGYLAGDRLFPGEAIDPPGGETVDLHRRVWIGKGGAQIPGTLRKPLSAFGLGGDFELVTPYGLACFKVPGGSMEYFHGGFSLQELIIPVLVVSPGKQLKLEQEPVFTWKIKPGSQKITSLFFSVTIEGISQTMFQVAPSIRVELREGDKIVSQPVSASYGFNQVTRDVNFEFDPKESSKLLRNTVMLQITEVPTAKSIKLFILDAETGVSLVESLEVEVDILT